MKRVILLISTACFLVSSHFAFAQPSDEKNFLSMYFSDAELMVESATRSPEAVSHVAENMTVVTAADIERMNAHTLADVLNTVPGVQVWTGFNPGQQATVNILGAAEPHVTVIMDGVVRNYLWSQFAEVGMIPVQNIEKVEIIKGPASSAWGSALGGVVNIITKSGRIADQGGVLSGSYGTKNFNDLRAEVRGKQDRTGYYLSAGRLQSNQLVFDTSASEQNVYAKLSYDLTNRTDVQLAFDYERTWRDDYLDLAGDSVGSDLSQHLHSTITINSAVTNNLDLNISAWMYEQYQDNRAVTISTGDIFTYKEQNQGNGVRAKLTWKGAQQTIVAGVDADAKTDTIPFIAGGRQSIRQEAVYLNDTISLDRLTVIPGIRLDHVSANGDITSPSLGLTYGLGNNTLLRAFVAHGFSVPSPADTSGAAFWLPNPDLKVETVWSYQAGIESAMKHLWMKLTLFRSDVKDKIDWVLLGSGDLQVQNVEKERYDILLIEAKTAPVYNTSLSASAEFITAKDLETGEHLPQIPVQVYDIGFKYDDRQSFNALLHGRHITGTSWIGASRNTTPCFWTLP